MRALTLLRLANEKYKPLKMNGFWDSCLTHFEKQLSAQQFNTWIKPLRFENAFSEGGELRLVAPNRFVMQWVRERFLGEIEEISRSFFPSPVGIALTLPEAPHPEVVAAGRLKSATTIPARQAPALVHTEGRPAIAPAYEKTRLNPEFTFDNLVTGKANQLARAAAVQISDNLGVSYNPLFVYGGVGLGKTHLIHAIGNHVFAHNPGLVIRYAHAEDYVADVVRAYQQKSFDAFKRYYRTLDLLLIDDIQFFGGKDRTQEEFFFAFNSLIEAKKQIIITCDTYPKEIEGLQDRLVSRFDWGLTVAIEPPELEMRVAILNQKAFTEHTVLPEDVSFFIGKHLHSNVREIEGALKKVMAYCRFHGREITLETAKDALKDLLSAQNRQISVENIQRTVSDFYKIKPSEMHSKKRNRNIARPRQIAMYLARELTQTSLPDIGASFGGRDHTTVLHACRKIAELRDKHPEINREVLVLTQVLRG
jgi:chromosomal replication initiator protein